MASAPIPGAQKSEVNPRDAPHEQANEGRDAALSPGATTQDNIEAEGKEPLASPFIKSISWGRIDIEGMGEVKDVKVWPGGGRVWDWAETGTKHSPGIQVLDVEELLAHGAQVVVLSRGMDKRLGVADAVVDAIQRRGVTVHVAETREAVTIYNKLTQEVRVGGLFHSTC
jgi:hypothetical protein